MKHLLIILPLISFNAFATIDFKCKSSLGHSINLDTHKWGKATVTISDEYKTNTLKGVKVNSATFYTSKGKNTIYQNFNDFHLEFRLSNIESVLGNFRYKDAIGTVHCSRTKFD